MIHIITIHSKIDKWIDPQLKQISKYISNYKVWAYCDGFNILKHKHKFYFCENFKNENKKKTLEASSDHMVRLNSLTQLVLDDPETQESDFLIWMDSDAFPVNHVNDYISKKLLEYPLIAVNRPENGGDVIPHPSFTCTHASFWKNHRLNWDGLPVDDPKKLCFTGGDLYDTGGKLYKYLLDQNIDWYRLLRTRSLTKHKVFFTIYDDLIYHHGAGSRAGKHPVCRGGDFGTTVDSHKMFDLMLEYFSINSERER